MRLESRSVSVKRLLKSRRAMSTVDVIIYLVLGLVLILGIMIIQGGTFGKFMKSLFGIGERGTDEIKGLLCEDSSHTRGCMASCEHVVNSAGELVNAEGKALAWGGSGNLPAGVVLITSLTKQEVRSVKPFSDCNKPGWKCCELKKIDVSTVS